MRRQMVKVGSCVLLLVGLTVGCATPPPLNLSDTPVAARKSPLSTLQPLTVALRVEDQRPPNERPHLASIFVPYKGLRPIVSSAEISSVISDALTQEFLHNGHTVLDYTTDHADVLVDVTVQRYWSQPKGNFASIDMRGFLNVSITFISPGDKVILGHSEINTAFQETLDKLSVEGEDFLIPLKGALADFIRNFSRDSKVLEALRRVQKA
jgi:uncharacterized lipoprotein YajG